MHKNGNNPDYPELFVYERRGQRFFSVLIIFDVKSRAPRWQVEFIFMIIYYYYLLFIL